MKHLKFFESQRFGTDPLYDNKSGETWSEQIAWLHDSFFNKIDVVLGGSDELCDRLDGTLNRMKYGQLRLQLGISTGGSIECLFMDECKLIFDKEDNEESISNVIKQNSGFNRWDDKYERMKTGKVFRTDLSRRYFPYYKLEGSFNIDKDIGNHMQYKEGRYARWITKILEDIYPGFKVSSQIQHRHTSCHVWLHLRDIGYQDG